jgi:hypothetical protein
MLVAHSGNTKGTDMGCRLKDYMDAKGNFYEQPPLIVQSVDPVDDVAEQILNHMRYGYSLTSLTPINSGNQAGRILMLFQKAR